MTGKTWTWPQLILLATLALLIVSGAAALTVPLMVHSGGDVLLFSAGQQRIGQRDLYLYDIQHRLLLTLAAHPADDNQPRWSPDGQRVVFDSARSDPPSLWIVTADGRSLRQLTDLTESSHSGRWSPDGLTIAFVHVPFMGNDQLTLVPADGGTSRVVASGLIMDHIRWSPDSARLLFTAGLTDTRRVYVASVDGPSAVPVIDQLMRYAVWSPDGTRLALVDDSGIYVARADDLPVQASALRRVAGSGPAVPVWSPDGRFIAYIHNDTASTVVRVVRAESGHLHGSAQSRTALSDVLWAPDGQSLLARGTDALLRIPVKVDVRPPDGIAHVAMSSTPRVGPPAPVAVNPLVRGLLSHIRGMQWRPSR
ncbi:MAG: TolB family protein [Chloroflexota bacterium]